MKNILTGIVVAVIFVLFYMLWDAIITVIRKHIEKLDLDDKQIKIFNIVKNVFWLVVFLVTAYCAGDIFNNYITY